MFSPLSIGTALGGFTSGFMDSQRQLQQRQAQQQAMQLNALRMKQAQQAQQAQSLAFPALLGLSGAGGGGAPQLPSGDAPPVPGGGGDAGPTPAGLDGGAQPPMPGASSQPNIGGGPKMTGGGFRSLPMPSQGGGAYGVPGAVMNYGRTTGEAPGSNLTQITDAQGNRVTVNKAAAGDFQGFLNALESRGYSVKDLGGYNNRSITGGSGPSEHAFGDAIDINPTANPRGGGKTDLPADIADLAKSYGLVWGGQWKGDTYDPMHVQWGGPEASRLAALARGGNPSAGSAGDGTQPVSLQRQPQGGGEASPQQIAHNAQRQIPPQQWGNLSIQQLAQSIERVNPGADPAVKMMALETASKLLAPMQQQQWEQYKFGIEEEDKLRIHEDTLANQRLQHEETSAFRSAMLNNRAATQQKPIPEKDEDGTTYLMYPPDQPGGKPRYTTLEGDEYHPKGMVKVGTSTQTINPEAQKMMADGIAKYQLPPLTGWALKSSAGQQIMADVLKQNPQYDATKFTGKAAGARSVGTRSAQLEMNTDVAEQEIPLTLETSRKIDRTEFPTINSMVIAVEKGTGNPDVIKFLDQLNALKYTYAAALSRTGTNTVDAMRRFDQILDPAWSQGQIEAALEQFKATLGAERRGIDKSRGLGGEASPQAVPQPGTVQDGYRFKGGDPAQESNWERVQ